MTELYTSNVLLFICNHFISNNDFILSEAIPIIL